MGLYSGEGGKPGLRLVGMEDREFHALTRFWNASGKGIKASAAFGIKLLRYRRSLWKPAAKARIRRAEAESTRRVL